MHKKHGLSPRGPRTPEYSAWVNMRARVLNSQHPRYADYGGRGIKISDRWSEFPAFLADMGPRPSARHSLDRINNDGNYEPGNCRWATSKEQSRNKRGTLSPEQLTLIRTSTLPSTKLAPQIGIDASMVRAIRRGVYYS